MDIECRGLATQAYAAQLEAATRAAREYEEAAAAAAEQVRVLRAVLDKLGRQLDGAMTVYTALGAIFPDADPSGLVAALADAVPDLKAGP